MLKIFTGVKSQAVPDEFNDMVLKVLRDAGFLVDRQPLGSDLLYRFFVCRRFPLSRRFFDYCVAPLHLWKAGFSINDGDWVWINGLTKVLADTRCSFEKKIKKRGGVYIWHIQDDWLSSPYYGPSAHSRLKLADVVAVVTPQLKDRILEAYPNKRVILVEEPIDPERTGLVRPPLSGEVPVLAWTGRGNLFRLPGMADILTRVYEQVPFKVRIVCGQEQPDFDFPIPWEWQPFRLEESRSFDGALAGIANLEKTSYDECKGNYKVKTYMAMGLCPVATRFGYNLNLIKHGETGFLVDGIDEWVATLVDLLKNHQKTVQIGRNARRFIERKYTHEKIVSTWVEALKSLNLDQCVNKNQSSLCCESSLDYSEGKQHNHLT